MAEAILLMSKVSGAVYIKPAAAAVEGYIALRSHYWVFDSLLLIVSSQYMRELQDHIWLGRHLAFLEIGKILRVDDLCTFTCLRVFHVEKHCSAFFH